MAKDKAFQPPSDYPILNPDANTVHPRWVAFFNQLEAQTNFSGDQIDAIELVAGNANAKADQALSESNRNAIRSKTNSVMAWINDLL